MSNFFKFPSTPHLAVLEGVSVRGDKVMTAQERDAFLSHEILVEEKIDGANLGISFDEEGNLQAQNRGAYLLLPAVGQWKKLDEWLGPKMDKLFEYLADRYILFGEWCYAKHSVYYDSLPDWFLGFDIYDKVRDLFLHMQERDHFFQELTIIPVPKIAQGVFTFDHLQRLFDCSKVGNEPAEGLYFRYDEGNSVKRAKLVRRSFIQAQEEHWTRMSLIPNTIKQEMIA